MTPVKDRRFAHAEAAQKIIEIANGVEPVQDRRIYIEKINRPMLFIRKMRRLPDRAGLERAIKNGLLEIQDSCTYVKFTQAGAQLFT